MVQEVDARSGHRGPQTFMHRQFDGQRNRILADISSEAQLEDFPHRVFINGVVSINIRLADWDHTPGFPRRTASHFDDKNAETGHTRLSDLANAMLSEREARQCSSISLSLAILNTSAI